MSSGLFNHDNEGINLSITPNSSTPLPSDARVNTQATQESIPE